MVAGIGAGALKVSNLEINLKKLIFNQITAKSPSNGQKHKKSPPHR